MARLVVERLSVAESATGGPAERREDAMAKAVSAVGPGSVTWVMGDFGSAEEY